MHRLLPLLALHAHAPLPPVVDAPFQGDGVTQGIVLAEEEEGWRRNRVVVENLDAALVEVRRVAFEEPEVKHGGIFDEGLKTWQ